MQKNYFRILFFLLCFYIAPAHAQIDTLIGIKVPKKDARSYKKLAHALCDTLPDDHTRVNAIYNWITHNIRYDVGALLQGDLKEEKVEKVFRSRKGMCAGYSLLLAAMCREIGIKAVMVEGYAKDWMFDDGDKLYIPRHAWNAVYVNGKWQLIDVTWGAGGLSQSPGWLKQQMNKAADDPSGSGRLRFRRQYDTSFFLADPLVFRVKHLSADPVWQLTDTPMPIQVFEAGESAILAFNREHPVLVQNLPELDKLSTLDEQQKVQYAAERITEYNPRFRILSAAKHQADAVDTIAAGKAGSTDRGEQALSNVKLKLKDAAEEVAFQKKMISTEYTALKHKNKVKGMEAQKYTRTLRSDNKRMMAQCEARIKMADTRVKSIGTREKTALVRNKDIGTHGWNTLVTAKRQEPAQSPFMMTLQDSVRNRNARIAIIKQQVEQEEAHLKATRKESRTMLDTLAGSFMLADSALVQETINRLRMHDNYDEEVMKWNRIVKRVRLEDVDSLQKNYMSGYDSVLQRYEALRKVKWEELELYRKNLKDLEQYKRKNNTNQAVLAEYIPLVQAYEARHDAYMRTLHEMSAYIKANKELFGKIVKLYKRQEKLVGYMEKSEEKRSKLEEKNLKEKEAFDKRENKKQDEQLKETGKKAEKLLAERS